MSVTDLDDFDLCVIIRLVYTYHLQKKRHPSVKLLLADLTESINFQVNSTSLRLIIMDLGITCGRTKNNRNLLV